MTVRRAEEERVPRDRVAQALAWCGRLWSRIRTLSPLTATAERVPIALSEDLRNGAGPYARASSPRPALPAAEHGGFGLSAKLLLLTILFVMLAEVLIFVPSVANFRITWLTDRLTAARLAALSTELAPEGQVPAAVRNELLQTAQVRAVAWKRNNERRLVLPADNPPEIDASYDFRASAREPGMWNELALRLHLIWDALVVFPAGKARVIRVVGEPPGVPPGDFIEIVLPESPLKKAMIRYGLNVLGLSVIISIITAALVYFTLNALLVQPMMRLTRYMLRFSENPEDASRIIVPSQRRDEIGTAERELAHMQSELTQTLQQKNRLAALGLAVSKISHDLRNMLASAQLISDRLGSLSDPTVQRFAPKLIASLGRAISFCEGTLRFGRAEEAQPRRELVALRNLVEEVGDSLGLPREGAIGWHVAVEDGLKIDADREQLFRVLSNLCRNALQALEQLDPARGQIEVSARREGRRVSIVVSDDGPGVPEIARANLFKAFHGARKGGTGLGLTVAHELVAAHGGVMRLRDVARGAAFELEIPDR
jgi:signal transduction histidine kinase